MSTKKLAVMAILALIGVQCGRTFNTIGMFATMLSAGMFALWLVLTFSSRIPQLSMKNVSFYTCGFVIPMWLWDLVAMARYNDIPKYFEWMLK